MGRSRLIKGAARHGQSLPRIVLSDLFPDISRFRYLQAEYGEAAIGHVDQPLSAMSVTDRRYRARSICTALHHFTPEQAKAIVRDALENGDGFFVMEPFERNLRHVVMMLISGPWIYFLAPFFAERFQLRKLLVCTLFPIVPLMILWDGIVSVLRMHTEDELRQMIPRDRPDRFTVASGTRTFLFCCRSTYFYVCKRS